MTWKCFFFGCRWDTGATFISSNERLLVQHCTRCHACRTVSR